jgi:hypothetical protein
MSYCPHCGSVVNLVIRKILHFNLSVSEEKRTEDKGGKIDSNDKSDCSSGSDIIPDNADDIDKCGESIRSNSTAEKGDVFVKCGG